MWQGCDLRRPDDLILDAALFDPDVDNIRFTPLPEGNGDQKRQRDTTSQ
jgi:hypothetical protein